MAIWWRCEPGVAYVAVVFLVLICRRPQLWGSRGGAPENVGCNRPSHNSPVSADGAAQRIAVAAIALVSEFIINPAPTVAGQVEQVKHATVLVHHSRPFVTGTGRQCFRSHLRAGWAMVSTEHHG